MKKVKNILVFTMNLSPRMVDDVRTYEKSHGTKYRIMLLWDSRIRLPEGKEGYDILVQCDFSKPHKITEALLPYQDELLAITCRSEANIARFAKIIPHVPYLRTPTSESLLWATDKYEMRKRFRLYNSKIVPAFTLVKHNTKTERDRIKEKVGFPMVIKPTNLAGSLLVSVCYHPEELDKTLRAVFRKLRAAYKKDGRLEEPKVIAEAYMEGDLYSIDAYVDARGGVYHCPLVRQRTARESGRDDFYNYLQITPTVLKKESVERARAATESAIHALGLRSTSAHTELMKIDDEWKVVEVGPRLGGFRDILHSLSCDINHTMNDIAVRIPRKPIIPKKCKGYAAYMKYFAEKEGKITGLTGIKKIEELESFYSIKVNKKIGDRSVFAKNGGRSIFNAVLYNAERSHLLADIRRIEQMVKIKVEGRNGKAKAVKAPAKKTGVKKAKKK